MTIRDAYNTGRFFVCELHPFKQYLGGNAGYQGDQGEITIPAFVHHISAFLDTAASVGLTLADLKEWWHEEDQQAPPRLVSFVFAKYR